MRSVAAVRSRGDIPARSRRTPRAAVTSRTAVRQSGANRVIRVQVSHPIVFDRPHALRHGELSLKQLPAAPDRTKRIPVDDVQRRQWREYAAPTRADLIAE